MHRKGVTPSLPPRFSQSVSRLRLSPHRCVLTGVGGWHNRECRGFLVQPASCRRTIRTARSRLRRDESWR